MTTSTILFLTATGCGLLFSALAVYAQTRDAGFKRVRWTAPVALLLGATAFGGLAYLLDSGLAEKTLYEIDAEGPGAAVPAGIEFDVPVEHPGAVHDLLVAPTSGVDVDAPAEIRVQLSDPAGHVLLDRTETLEPRCDGETDRCDWDAWSAEFTPAAPGPHALVVTVLTPGVPVVHVRVGDEQKTDGHRAPGY
jgi:hypothetical protein